MKNKIILLFLVLVFSGCIDNVLERKPLDMISDSDVWTSEKLIDIYLVALYDNLPIGMVKSGYTYECHLTDESAHPYAGTLIRVCP